jgi:hypothetical protein
MSQGPLDKGTPSCQQFGEQNGISSGCLGCCDSLDGSKKAPHNTNAIPNRPRQNSDDFHKGEMKETEDFLAAEMHKLSIQEVSKALDDVHCVGEELEEDPDMMKRSLAEFDEEVKAERNPIYELAASQNRAYVEDETFRLKFLRANFYDVKKSVRQMMNLLRHKATYFGKDKVARDILLSDLNGEDVDLMMSGLFHIQDGRDRSGRVVVYMMSHALCRCKEDTMVRAFLHSLSTMTICFSLTCHRVDTCLLLLLVQLIDTASRSANEGNSFRVL